MQNDECRVHRRGRRPRRPVPNAECTMDNYFLCRKSPLEIVGADAHIRPRTSDTRPYGRAGACPRRVGFSGILDGGGEPPPYVARSVSKNACHCEERSDVAIRFSPVEADDHIGPFRPSSL